MELRWSQDAAADLEGIAGYLFEHAPDRADRLVRALYDGPAALRTFPNRGRPGKKEGTRELVICGCCHATFCGSALASRMRESKSFATVGLNSGYALARLALADVLPHSGRYSAAAEEMTVGPDRPQQGQPARSYPSILTRYRQSAWSDPR